MKKILSILLLLHSSHLVGAEEKQKKTDPYKIIASELLKNITDTDKVIAVTEFPYSDGRDSKDGSVVAERITAELAKTQKITVVERKEIEKVLAELKFQRSGVIDPNSIGNIEGKEIKKVLAEYEAKNPIKAIGKMLGADWMILGSLTELPNNKIEIIVRLVGVESGEIMDASVHYVDKDWTDAYKKLVDEKEAPPQKVVYVQKTSLEPGEDPLDFSEYFGKVYLGMTKNEFEQVTDINVQNIGGGVDAAMHVAPANTSVSKFFFDYVDQKDKVHKLGRIWRMKLENFYICQTREQKRDWLDDIFHSFGSGYKRTPTGNQVYYSWLKENIQITVSVAGGCLIQVQDVRMIQKYDNQIPPY